MHVLLVCVPVIMLSSFVESSKEDDIQDLSEWCTHDRIIYIYLTSGVGSSDKSVQMIAKEKNLNCTLIYSVKPKQKIMLVLEFPDLKPFENICITEQNISVTVSDFKDRQKCQFDSSQLIYSKMSQEKIFIHFRHEQEIGTIKITATSMRDSKNSKCSDKNEVECWVDGKIFCMTHTAICDGHNNCGVADSFDEDIQKCEERRLTLLMILSSIVMGIMSLVLFTSLWMAFLPKRKEIFVYQFDQRMPLFDSESGIMYAEIEIQILFPKELKTNT